MYLKQREQVYARSLDILEYGGFALLLPISH